MQSSPAFRDAYILLRVWANQRGYGEGPLCVRGFEAKGSLWASVLSVVIDGEAPLPVHGKGNIARRRPVGKNLSSYQLFRASLDFLGKNSFLRSTFVLTQVHQPSKNLNKYLHL